MLPHRIRLRGPWQLIPLNWANGDTGQLPAPIAVRMPVRWSDCGLADFAGRVRLLRRFGMPRSLDSFERVWLTLAGVAGRTEIWLNDERLGDWQGNAGPIEIEITRRLRDRNELRIEVAVPEGKIGGEVALEIRGQAWLSGLAASRRGDKLAIRGTLNGQADEPLDLYAIMGRFTVIQKRIEVLAPGQRFELVSEPLPPDRIRATVRMELVCGSNIWHSAEAPVAGE